MTAVVCGSFAYDNILNFEGKFEDHLISSELNNINISFLCTNMRREYGGCAGNIIYNLVSIGADAFSIGTMGSDAGPYIEWMRKNNINTDYIEIIKDSYTAQAYITTDRNANQITTFHPGAMQYSNQIKIPDNDSVTLGLISPDGRDGMIDHAKQLIEMKVPYVFDPGQGMPMFNKDELNFFSDNASWIIMNDYEFKMYNEITGHTPSDIISNNKVLVVTDGDNGSNIFTIDKKLNISTPKVEDPKDPTGCGDAYRAGIIYGIMKDMPLEKIGELSSELGALKVKSFGTQNHTIDNNIKKLL
ncbi:MAG: carbohydrate kinase family protein [Gammaproteobacteria bacterium]|jgi:adenosine kinase|nr:carbohydrate kinase family protein [Gammaproteobacteria bacterium]MBT6754536.1 carbohydrate kinase family protein [Gammaproteobacteria bacterium]MBT7523689.1 carbohydrate kinase family protein [Gammaproteobacteria bacterium]MBT7814575.1 carbohydrate kinase family protein [Gammaproteobacteria bacterium]|tara:strand:- start:696 stop:1601 length:906 start_codon:yes stop_codon:yes gene_type:complete